MSATLHFPPILELRVIEAETRRPVSDVALMLTIFAPRKNNYHLAMATDLEGKARVSMAQIRESVKTDQELFPMDYASPLEECSAGIEAKICSSDDVKRAIAAMEMFKSVTKIDDNLIRGFKASRNEEYVSKSQRVIFDRPKDRVVVTIVVRRAYD